VQGGKQMLDASRQNFLTEAHTILAECSKHFCRSVSIEENLLCKAIPDYQLLGDYLRDIGVLKQSTENEFLFRHEYASNFFDYFETFTFLLFEQAVPVSLAKEIASELTLHLIDVWDKTNDSDAYENIMSSHCYIQGMALELQNCRGEVGTHLGEILAILCQMAVIQIDPQKTNREWNGATCGVEIHL
jgi:hypothetical protein